MKQEVFFTEKQKFTQWWIWMVLMAIVILFSLRIIEKVQTVESSITDADVLIPAALLLITIVLLLIFRLDTVIKSDGIYVRFLPFQKSFKHYSWNEISKIYIRKYKPIKEYGGWGIRYGMQGKGKALNVSGNEGLQVQFNDNKKLLIGTKQALRIKETLLKLNRYTEEE